MKETYFPFCRYYSRSFSLVYTGLLRTQKRLNLHFTRKILCVRTLGFGAGHHLNQQSAERRLRAGRCDDHAPGGLSESISPDGSLLGAFVQFWSQQFGDGGRVGDVFPHDVRSGTMYSLEDADMVADIGRRCKSKSTD